MSGRAERKALMRRATARALLLAGCAATACAPALDRVSPQLPEYRLAILVRAVDGQCRTTTVPALALVTSRQTVTWEVISVDRAACPPADVRIAAKTRRAASGAASVRQYPQDEGFEPAPGERSETWSVRGLRAGRYQYDVTIRGVTEDPELEVWR
jgi:hypothetical protein